MQLYCTPTCNSITFMAPPIEAVRPAARAHGAEVPIYGDGDIDDPFFFGDDVIYGGEGTDTISAGNGDDILHGGEDFDFLYGGAGEDIIYGGDGGDFIDSGYGWDTIFGGDGCDVVGTIDGGDVVWLGDCDGTSM